MARGTHQNSSTPADREKWFDLWCKVRFKGGLQEVANTFGRCRATVEKWCKREGWEARHDAILAKVQADHDKSIEREERRGLKDVKAIRDMAATKLLERLKNDPDYKLTAFEFVAVSKLYEEMMGRREAQPETNVENNVTVQIWERLEPEQRDRVRSAVSNALARQR